MSKRNRPIAALTREHGGWESRLRDGQPAGAVGSSALFRRAERGRNKALDEVSAAIPRYAVARNEKLSRGAFSAVGWSEMLDDLIS